MGTGCAVVILKALVDIFTYMKLEQRAREMNGSSKKSEECRIQRAKLCSCYDNLCLHLVCRTFVT